MDGLATSPSGDPLLSTSVLALTPAALLVGYGVARVTAVGCNELRNAVFAKVCALCIHECTVPLQHQVARHEQECSDLMAQPSPATATQTARSTIILQGLELRLGFSTLKYCLSLYGDQQERT